MSFKRYIGIALVCALVMGCWTGTACAQTYSQLQSGDQGKAVLEMKLRLQELGYFRADAALSESYNATCVERVQMFQEQNGLEATGVADEATLTLLYSGNAVAKDGNKKVSDGGKNDKNNKNDFTEEMARRAVVVAMTNCFAMDVFTEDGNNYDPSKFHAYHDMDDFYITVDTDGTWSKTNDNTWHVKSMIMRITPYDLYVKITCDVTKEGKQYIVSYADTVSAAKEYINSNDESKNNISHLEPSEFNSFLTVPESLIEQDRQSGEERKKIAEKEERESWISSQFHWWDGRHKALCDIIKENMNDSDSFEHVDAGYIDIIDKTTQDMVNDVLKAAGIESRVKIGDLFVYEEFTAKNVFNATIKNIAYGIADQDSDTVRLIGIE